MVNMIKPNKEMPFCEYSENHVVPNMKKKAERYNFSRVDAVFGRYDATTMKETTCKRRSKENEIRRRTDVTTLASNFGMYS